VPGCRPFALTALLLLSHIAVAGSWETQSYRLPGGELVRAGMTATEVARQAGEPQTKRVVSTGIGVAGEVGPIVEVWTYRGSDGYYDLTLTGDKVTRIEVTPFR
jgi:hypothetical protein